MVLFQAAQSEQELADILALQSVNLAGNISEEEALEQGFLTIEHDLELLREMNNPYGHTIAKDGDTLAGFALTMTPDFRHRLPILVSLFELLDSRIWNGQVLGDISYVLMGQVCVAKAYRGQGVFVGLYRNMQQRMAPFFELIVTEISARNTRSLRAHAKVGFVEIHRYTAPDGKPWVVVLLPTKNQ